jgi:adenylate cyclase
VDLDCLFHQLQSAGIALDEKPVLMEGLALSIYRRWIKASNIGVREEFTIERIKRLRLANQVTIFTATLTIVYFLIFAFSSLPVPASIMVTAFVLYLAVLSLQRNGKYRVALIVLLINGNLQIASVSLLMGPNSGIHLFLVAAAMSPFLYFSLRDLKLISYFALLSLLLYIGLEITFWTTVPTIQVSETILWFCYTSTFISNMVAVVFFTFYLYDANFNAERALKEERRRSDNLLLNILPGAVVERLKNGETTIADYYDNVSIMFVDIVDFTPLSARLTAQETVELLSLVFTQFDSIVEKYGVEKMKTIGDGYYVASGVPVKREDHAKVLVEVALEMLSSIQGAEFPNGRDLEIRIGIDSGPVIAGVIGEKKFQYDLWGDTVNTASRMESYGEPGRIHISPSTRKQVQDYFKCFPRGDIEVKGKGVMATSFIDS